MPAPVPSVSVVLVCRNPGPRLDAALESLWSQQPARPEIIVIDGASSDGSAAWLAERRGELDFLVSEPDSSVYDAMNKGVAAATRDWILFLGADDRLASDAVIAEAGEALRLDSAGVIVGDAVYDDGRVYRLARRPRVARRNFVHHQATFYRRSLFASHGGFDTSLRVMGDYEFNLRLWRAGVGFSPLPLRISECASGGLSDAGNWLGYREEIAVRHRHLPAWRCVLWDLGSLARFLRKRMIRG